MNRFFLLLIIAGIVFLVILFLARPDLIKDIWIWVIGLAGTIIKSVDGLIHYFKNLFSKNETPISNTNTAASQPVQTATILPNSPAEKLTPEINEIFNGTTLTVLRYSDDGSTSIGLLYVNNKFYCYTLEDTFHEVKISGETRIPAGNYSVDFLKQPTDLTKKYREQFPDWFTFHLEIQKVKGFSGIYIHCGGTSKDTKGCLLVSDSLTISNAQTFLSNSRNTYERLYHFLSDEIRNGKKIRIQIKDESWFLNLKP